MGWLEVLALSIALVFLGWFCWTEYRWRVRSLEYGASDHQDTRGA